MIRLLLYDDNPCEECELARALCDADFEHCQTHGHPPSEDAHEVAEALARYESDFDFGGSTRREHKACSAYSLLQR